MSTKQREWLLWENVKNNILQLNTYKHNNISNPTSGRNTKFRHSFFEKVGLWLFLSANAKRKKHANTSFQKRLWQSLNYLWFAAMVDTMSFWQFLRETESYSHVTTDNFLTFWNYDPLYSANVQKLFNWWEICATTENHRQEITERGF